MAELSPTPPERARKAVALVLQHMQGGESASAIATAMGVSEATISRIKNERLEEVALFCAHLGIKWVPAHFKCIDAADFDFLTKAHVRMVQKAPQLLWDGE